MSSETALSELRLTTRVEHDRIERVLRLAEPMPLERYGFHGFGRDTGVMWGNFRVLAGLEIGESAHDTVRACQSARRTFAALIELFAPLAPEPEVPVQVEPAPQRIAPALPAAFGAHAPAAPRPAPADGDHIDLPVDDDADEGDTVFDLPLDEPAGGDTLPLPL